jgi:nucleoside-diphosphate-sugar epimerase
MKASAAEIVRKREDRSARLFLTGASGFVGSYIAASLLRDGYRLVLLCRPRNGSSAAERLARVFRWHGLDLGDRVTAIEGDVTKPRFGLTREAFLCLAAETDEIIHCASCTNFDERHRAEIYETNLCGTTRVLELAEAGPCAMLHYLSTAYSAGKRMTIAEALHDGPLDFHNPYEASKHEAELQVANRCNRAGIRSTVYRPSIIIGDSTDGKTMLFNAMYFPVKIAEYLATGFRKDIAEHGGELAARMGAHPEPDGTLHMPLRIDVGTEDGGVINLVPIDYVVAAFNAIMRASIDGIGVFHIVNPRPCTLQKLIDYSQRKFRVSGIQACLSGEFTKQTKSAIERRFDNFVHIYLPYMSDVRRFHTSGSEAILSAAGVTCPEVDYTLFERCIDYALAHDWKSPQESL